MTKPPTSGEATGEPLVLRAGPATATIHPGVGGRLGQLDLGGGPLLRGPAPELGWAHWGCYPLLPWSNRLPGGHLRFGELDARLPVNWPDGSAIHGLAAAVPWQVRSADVGSAELEVHVAGGPYRVTGSQRFELEPEQLRLRLAVTNDGDRPVPVGIGIHPWFRSGTVRVPADERWPGEPLPTGPPVPVAGRYDLRKAGVPAEMDTCFTALTEAVADVPGARLHWDGPVTDVVVYTGEPGWTCVEPVTMANGAMGLPVDEARARGVQVLDPGATLEVRYRFERR
ncbi:MAG TPA: hypothetical protein VHK88_05345 [Aquihabitans sp.]|nr:hypothetical protein [Aquihabitans sp.]